MIDLLCTLLCVAVGMYCGLLAISRLSRTYFEKRDKVFPNKWNLLTHRLRTPILECDWEHVRKLTNQHLGTRKDPLRLLLDEYLQIVLRNGYADEFIIPDKLTERAKQERKSVWDRFKENALYLVPGTIICFAGMRASNHLYAIETDLWLAFLVTAWGFVACGMILIIQFWRTVFLSFHLGQFAKHAAMIQNGFIMVSTVRTHRPGH